MERGPPHASPALSLTFSLPPSPTEGKTFRLFSGSFWGKIRFRTCTKNGIRFFLSFSVPNLKFKKFCKKIGNNDDKKTRCFSEHLGLKVVQIQGDLVG